jgi:transposase-like protein
VSAPAVALAERVKRRSEFRPLPRALRNGEIQAPLAAIYDVGISRDLISRATEKVTAELDAWRNRPLARVYAVGMIVSA